jgi:hypothetical protein
MFSRVLRMSVHPLSLVRHHMSKNVTLVSVKGMAKNHDQMSNDVIIILAQLGDQEAREERLIREIMDVDGVEQPEAKATMKTIRDFNRGALLLPTLPYKIGIFSAVRPTI